MNTETMLEAAYAAFNARDIDAALVLMSPDVVWPNGMEGGIVHGHGGIRDYWERQWTLIDPHVEPLRIVREQDGRFRVEVHAVVKDLSGSIIVDQLIQHVYEIRDGLVTSMEIRE